MTPPKIKFEESIPELRQIAYRVASKWGKMFSLDEIVNEAWLSSGCKKDELIDKPLLLRTAHLDMIDYIREKVGRKSLKKKKPKYITNLDTHMGTDGEYPANNFLDLLLGREDKGYKNLEDKDLINHILSEPTIKQAQVLRKYFLEGKTLGEVGRELGDIKECTVSTHKKKALASCRKRFKGMEILSL